jgi:acyl-CoA synthetase (AMP-forming)/AMP-acid ligase II
LSRRELRDQALSFAGKLERDLGYKRGDKLAVVLGENCLESIVAQLGAALAGVTVVTAKSPKDSALSQCRGIVVSTAKNSRKSSTQ